MNGVDGVGVRVRPGEPLRSNRWSDTNRREDFRLIEYTGLDAVNFCQIGGKDDTVTSDNEDRFLNRNRFTTRHDLEAPKQVSLRLEVYFGDTLVYYPAKKRSSSGTPGV